MDPEFLDTSFTLYHVAESSIAYRNLYSADLETLSTWSRSLKDYLETHTPRYKDDLDDETEKTGVLRECKFTAVEGPANSTTRQRPRNAISIEVQYAKVTYRFVLYGSTSSTITGKKRLPSQSTFPLSLILTKASSTHLKRVLSFLEEKYAISTAQLKLPSTLLLLSLQDYVTRLSSTWSSTDGETSSFLSDPGINDASAQRQAMLKSVIGSLRMSISISNASEVAPELKTIDLEVPSETVSVLFAKAASSSSSSTSFLDELRKHIHERTGLILPLTAKDAETEDANQQGQTNHSGGQENENLSIPSEPPLRVSKILCAAFAISVDGRLKFASRPIDTATNYEDTVRAADVEMLDAIMLEARKRGATE